MSRADTLSQDYETVAARAESPTVWITERTIEAAVKETRMSWARFDDNYSLNPKILAAGYLAELLDMRAIIWCARYETNGFVSADSLSIVGRSIPSVRRRVKELVEVGRWEEGEKGWWIVHYLTYNPSHEECEKRRKEGKERAARSRERNAHERRTSASGSGDPRGGDGEVSSFLDGFAISDCEICDTNGMILNENGDGERCKHPRPPLELVENH